MEVTKTAVGIVLGKFMPLHTGHEALIRFAADNSDRLIIVLGAYPGEPIAPEVRFNWLRQRYGGIWNREIHYVEDNFPKSEVASREVSKAWADYFKAFFPEVTCIFTSEPYGELVAEYMGIEHRCFDQPREKHPVSATMIRRDPIKYWNRISYVAQPHYLQKICLYGPESVGKSTMAQMLAEHFNTRYVTEVARDMMDTSYDCTYEDMTKIAEAHATAINMCAAQAAGGSVRRALFVDSDLMTTQVYSQHLFGKEPEIPQWIQDAIVFHLHLFLDDYVPYVQDGTRLGEHTRPALKEEFWKALIASGQPFATIKSGTWEGRYQQCIHEVEKLFESIKSKS